jgi:predicted metal-dependent phosphotriesterase family hydrolase
MGIPVTIHLDGLTFNTLEKVAVARGVSMRELIVSHLQAGIAPEPHSRVLTSKGAPVKHADVQAWVEAARMGVTNEVIAERWGVSRQLVSRCLIDRGIRRQKPRKGASA